MHDQNSSEQEVTVLFVDPKCPDGDTCDAIIDDTTSGEFLYFVATEETDPAVLARHRNRIGVGETLYRWPRRHGLPEVPPA